MRYARLRRVRPNGERAGELAAGADAELGEDLPEMVGDGGRADEQLRTDLRVGGTLAGQAGDQRLLRGQDFGYPGGALERLDAGRAQLGPRPFGERLHADASEQRVRAAQLYPGIPDAPLAAQPLAVDELGAAELRATGAQVLKRTAGTGDVLTAQEALIARLASQGASNPQIAAQLFISPATVAYHLGKVFAKLGISSRSQLARALPVQPEA